MITDKENEFVLYDKYDNEFRIELLKDGYWHFVINEEGYDEFSGIGTFIFKANNNRVIANLVVKLFNEISKSSDLKSMWMICHDYQNISEKPENRNNWLHVP